MANQEPNSILEPEEVWPPPPSLPPPATAPQEPFFIRITLETLILIDAGIGLASGAVHCLVRLLSHRPIDWQDTGIEAIGVTLTFFVLHLCLRFDFKKRQEIAAQEAAKMHAE